MSEQAQALPQRQTRSSQNLLIEMTVSRLRSLTHCLLLSVVTFILVIIAFHSLDDLRNTSPVLLMSGNLDLMRLTSGPNVTLTQGSNVTASLHSAEICRRHQPSLPKATGRKREALSCGRKSRKKGLQINIRKTKAMRINNKLSCSVVNKDGGTDEDIRCRINKDRYVFNTLKPIWMSTALIVRNKIWIFKTRTTKLLFSSRCLRNILSIRWLEVSKKRTVDYKEANPHRDRDQKV
ncbi:hypothetical protein EGW08_007147 [Elysia chlorotica]|uniref:DUF6451 domain-containing protein n=1 Tax=Elysia chlorotica TaxID=188477 RepID=A0A3S1HS93_ELYCH|nr:hypothetical protein EGW08_007147 [Elysia chlorotica]